MNSINPEIRQLGQIQLRRQLEKGLRLPSEPAVPERPEAREDSSQFMIDPSTVQRFVDVLRAMEPADLHRIDDLRQRIAQGLYTATPEELADPLLEAVQRGELA